MDVVDVIRTGLDSLPAGDFDKGLRSVLCHIEMAVRHLQTAQRLGEAELYTDAVYRCNEA